MLETLDSCDEETDAVDIKVDETFRDLALWAAQELIVVAATAIAKIGMVIRLIMICPP